MIHGSLVTLRSATLADRRAVYQWMAESDVTPSMMGPPHFPDAHVPTWEEFANDYVLYYFDGSRPDLGRSYIIEAEGVPVGHVSYSPLPSPPGRGAGGEGTTLSPLLLGEGPGVRAAAELDIWMRSLAHCGHGYGTDALLTLMKHLHETMHLREFIMRPSRRNTRAIRSYEKAGFVALPLTYPEQLPIYGPGDYEDTVVVRRNV
jgi:diamine N-acetyltransferase